MIVLLEGLAALVNLVMMIVISESTSIQVFMVARYCLMIVLPDSSAKPVQFNDDSAPLSQTAQLQR